MLITSIKEKLKLLYKSFIYKIFFIFYGKIEKGARNDKKLFIKNIILDKNLKYKIFSLQKSRLYTDRIHDTAAIIENKIIDGPSFQYRENKNSSYADNSVLKIGTPKIQKKIKGVVLSLLTGGAGNANYWHWLLDVLPRMKLTSEFIDLKKIDYFLLPSLEEKYQIETLDILNIPVKKRLSSKKFRHIVADQIIITDHPYNLLNDPMKDSLNIPNWIIEFLKNKFGFVKKISEKKFPKKIYIDRSDSKSNNRYLRKITNEKEVVNILKKNGFISMKLSDHHFSDQVNLFKNAEHIIGLHGSGFVNTIFCKPKTKITEFRSEEAGEIIKNLSIKNHLNYESIVRKPKSFVHLQLGDIEIPLDDLQRKI